MRNSGLTLLVLASLPAFAQQSLSSLSVTRIMRDPKWMGTSPTNISWGNDSKTIFFNWNPEQSVSDSLYYVTKDNLQPRKTTLAQRQERIVPANITYNSNRTAFVYEKEGDIFLGDTRTRAVRRITRTLDVESNPVFSFLDSKLVYTLNQNLYSWEISTGQTAQLTNFQKGNSPPRPLAADNANAQEKWLRQDQLNTFDVLRTRKIKRDFTDSAAAHAPKTASLKMLYTGSNNLLGADISPDGTTVMYRLYKPGQGKNTVVPNYVTESGFTEEIAGRTKVGAPEGSIELMVYQPSLDTVFSIKPDQLPGIRDIPAFYADYPEAYKKMKKDSALRDVYFSKPKWSAKGSHAVIEAYSLDHKDRWLILFDPQTRKITALDRQHDDAWIGGPGTGGIFFQGNSGWTNEDNFWFQSEVTGYAHLYTIEVSTGIKKALTSGQYEVQDARLGADKKYFYISTNEVHPGEQHYYRLPVNGGTPERLTTLVGAIETVLSPDEKTIAFLHSYSNRPWELYVQENKPGSSAVQVTNKAMSEEFASFPWMDPKVITFAARDGATVYARVYKPAVAAATHPAVLFVHGAGYLQNAHKWWSSYFREYMFNNLLAAKGYTVMDIDYRGSAGYGRDWRTGIYRFMGGKDLTDQEDAVKYMVDSLGVNAAHVGLYGGSYGGFITLMGMFTAPGTFAAGAALRPVTDWAQYNHGYTSNILNEPFTDSIAYRRSSPIYYAAGLRGHLLICHGMVDTNVNFQDAVKLSQRLIELGKDNWEIMGYPMEDHGFLEPSSWTDEYKRIFKLFETTLK